MVLTETLHSPTEVGVNTDLKKINIVGDDQRGHIDTTGPWVWEWQGRSQRELGIGSRRDYWLRVIRPKGYESRWNDYISTSALVGAQLA